MAITKNRQSAAKPLNILVHEEGSTTIPQGSTWLSSLGKGRNYSTILQNTKGIYIIINKINNKFYIGSSSNIRKRLLYHFSKLRNNKHSNNHLQTSFNKYLEHSFDFDIIEISENIKDTEQLYLSFCYKHYKNMLYNKDNKVSGSAGYLFSKEFRLQMSAARKNLPKSEDFKNKLRKPILQYNKEGIFIREFKGIREAATNMHCNHRTIQYSCNEINITAKGYVWRYKLNDKIDLKIIVRNRKRIIKI